MALQFPDLTGKAGPTLNNLSGGALFGSCETINLHYELLKMMEALKIMETFSIGNEGTIKINY